MAAEKHKLELILEHMENAVLLLDRYGRITSINRQGRELFNLQHTLLGQTQLASHWQRLFGTRHPKRPAPARTAKH